jgi:hypothetical protein
MKKFSFYVVIAVFWMLVALLLFEVAFQIMRPEPRYATWLEMHDRGFMQNRADFTTSHRGYGRNVRYWLGEQRTRVEGEVPVGRKNVLVLGDSFTFGLHLDFENVLTSLLNERFEVDAGMVELPTNSQNVKYISQIVNIESRESNTKSQFMNTTLENVIYLRGAGVASQYVNAASQDVNYSRGAGTTSQLVNTSSQNVIFMRGAGATSQFVNSTSHYVNSVPYFINAAVGGTGLADHLANLQVYGDGFSPSAVLVVLSIDDLARAVAKNLFVVDGDGLVESKRWEESGMKRFMEALPGYFFFSERSAFFNAVVTYLWAEMYFTDVTKNFDASTGYVIPPASYLEGGDEDYLYDLVRLIFAEMKAWTEERGIPLIVISNGYYLSEQNAYTHYLMGIMPEIATALEILYYDPGEELSRAVDGDFTSIQIEGEWHPEEEGNRLLAELVYPWLRGVLGD